MQGSTQGSTIPQTYVVPDVVQASPLLLAETATSPRHLGHRLPMYAGVKGTHEQVP